MNEHLVSQLLDEAEYHINHEKWLHATQALLRVLREHPERIDLSMRLAEVYARMGIIDAAERTLLATLARDPGNVDVLYALGRMLYASEHYDEALRYLEQLLPYHIPQAHFSTGLIHFKRQDYPAAERHFKRTVELDPEHPRGREMLGRTLIAQQRFADARDVLTEAAKHPQDDGTAWSLLGSANALLGRWDESLAAFDEAIRRKPTDAGMMGEVALALIRGGKLVEGESMLRRAAEVESNAPQVLLAWGVLAMERADRTKASDYFRQVLDIDPTNDAALQYLSLISPVGQPKA